MLALVWEKKKLLHCVLRKCVFLFSTLRLVEACQRQLHFVEQFGSQVCSQPHVQQRLERFCSCSMSSSSGGILSSLRVAWCYSGCSRYLGLVFDRGK